MTRSQEITVNFTIDELVVKVLHALGYSTVGGVDPKVMEFKAKAKERIKKLL